MVDPIAVWGAATGSIGAGIALRQELIARRKRLAVRPGINYNVSRREPVGAVTHAWAFVQFWNTGNRPLGVERTGFRYFIETDIGGGVRALQEVWAEIHLKEPIVLAVDGPSAKVHTPLGPMLAAGIDPFSDVEAYVMTAGDREWLAPPQPLIQGLMPPMTPDLLWQGLTRLKDEAELPVRTGHLIGLKREEPYLPPDDSDGITSADSPPVNRQPLIQALEQHSDRLNDMLDARAAESPGPKAGLKDLATKHFPEFEATAAARAEHDSRTLSIYFERFRTPGLPLFDEAVAAWAGSPKLRPLVENPTSVSDLREVVKVFRAFVQHLREQEADRVMEQRGFVKRYVPVSNDDPDSRGE